MSSLRDAPSEHRFEQDFEAPDGQTKQVFADYAVHGDTRAILHVEADPLLQGTGAAGKFMQALSEHARAEKLKLEPRCSYAVAWLKRHPEFTDILA